MTADSLREIDGIEVDVPKLSDGRAGRRVCLSRLDRPAEVSSDAEGSEWN